MKQQGSKLQQGIIFRASLSGAKKELFSQKACKIHEVSANATLTGKVQEDKKLGCGDETMGAKVIKAMLCLKTIICLRR